ncbi:MAG: Myo-inositol 2-dehydrogenase 1 [Candidatus Carbobacillus altaicus]|uniref:Myo-inositol 2-dehydrogenase 1 n=1 Tax=Candidatus Carbonibacillus altaicus TaxID=2163959 RepID=A0A2R6Y3U8_9BACL|nr:MAG: Myo-inositol 2-dehydrogenase 1 [Candidatus Carbobacillus altaicus]
MGKTNTLGIGVIGAGTISEHHLKAYASHPEARIFAIADLNRERAEQRAKQFGAERVYVDYRELLADPHVDAVSVCTWNNTHAEIALAALQAGKHVLVEKPMTKTVEEAEALVRAARDSDKVVQVGFVRRYGSTTEIVKSFVDAGDLGEIYYAKSSIIRRLGNPGGWFADRERSGGGPLYDIGVHVIDLAWYLMGKPKPIAVTGSVYHKLGNRAHIRHLSFYKAADYRADVNTVEDLALALIKFDNGASLYVDVSYTLHAKKDELTLVLYGDKGGVEVEPELMIVTERHNTIVNLLPQVDFTTFDFAFGFRSEIHWFIDSVLGRKQTLSPPEDGLEVMKMLSAVYRSAEEGRELRLQDREA